MKGGAAGGGYAQVVPMEDINLHFTGDFHAITSAHNLLSALIDNHIYWGNALGIDSRRVAWRRVMDMNDRALREIVCSLGGVANGYPREAGFDITVASEVMAIFCLAKNLDDLKERLGKIIVAYTRDRKPILAKDLKAHGAMTALLKEALAPNLVQTLEGTPAFVHGGPFANIAHGCNSVLATTTALKLADYVVTEAGFGADLGGEKFIDIKCRKAGLTPDCVVLVATIRALKMHGGVKKDDLKKEDFKALEAGMANLQRHVENMKKFGLPVVVSINRFSAAPEGQTQLRALIAEIRKVFPQLVELYDNTASLQDRTVSTGFVQSSLVRQYGAGGYVGRASGRAFDARQNLKYPPYDQLSFEVPVLDAGDVDARVWIRIREVDQSLSLIEQILDRLPRGPVGIGLNPAGGREGLGVAEAFRGDVLVWGEIRRRPHRALPSARPLVVSVATARGGDR